MTADRWLYSSSQAGEERGGLAGVPGHREPVQSEQTARCWRTLRALVVSDGLKHYVGEVVRVLESSSGVLYRSTGDEKKDDMDVDAETAGDEESQTMSSNGQPKADSTDEKAADESAQQAKLYLETVLTSVLLSLLAGSMTAMSPVYQALLPHIIRSQHVTDVECAALGKQVAKVAAWAALKGNVTAVRSGEVSINRQFDTSGVIANVLSEVSDLLSPTSARLMARQSERRAIPAGCDTAPLAAHDRSARQRCGADCDGGTAESADRGERGRTAHIHISPVCLSLTSRVVRHRFLFIAPRLLPRPASA